MREVLIFDEIDHRLWAALSDTAAYEAVRKALIHQLETRYENLKQDRADDRTFVCVINYTSAGTQHEFTFFVDDATTAEHLFVSDFYHDTYRVRIE